VASLDAFMESFWRTLGGKRWSETWHDPLQKVGVAFIYPQKDGDPSFELVEPAGNGSPVQDFLAGGGGLHHVCYEMGDFDRAVSDARCRGLVLVRRPQLAVAFA
jgi:methylmalonyl-CoA/ethylmalonyl-CoA epimerase